MANIFAVISKAIFEKQAKGLDVGDVHAIASYDSNPAAFAPLADGGKLYVVTARPGDVLWLVAVLDQPKLKSGKWTAPANATPITDITKLIPKLKFASGNGLHAKPGQLGMSLQTPRALADDDVALLDGALGGKPATSKKSVVKAAKTSVRPDLEKALVGGSDDDFLVYADVLQQRGDPRGELIHVQHALAKKPKDKALKTAETKLFKDHADALLGPLAPWKKSLTWKLGFVDTATFTGEMKRTEYDVLLDHPSMAHVRELDMNVGHHGAPGVVLRLAGKPRPALHALNFHQGYSSFDHDDEGGSIKPMYSTEYDRHDHKKGDALWAAAPNLEKLRVCGFGLFHSLEHAKLVELSIEGYPFCGKVAFDLPNVTTIRVQLDCDDTGTGVDWSVSAIETAWTGWLPKLRKLDLEGCSSVGYMDYEMYAEDGDDEDEDEIDDYLAWSLRRNKEFKKLATQLDELVLPDETLKGKAIAKWLKG
jgi:uncharacterized protein (TIGR02996 family)